MTPTGARVHALGDAALGWVERGVWVVCIGVYLTVFFGGVQAGGAELITMGRAVAFTVAAAVLGRLLLRLLSGATLPVRQGRMAEQDGPVGSLVDLTSSTNVAQHIQDEAEAA